MVTYQIILLVLIAGVALVFFLAQRQKNKRKVERHSIHDRQLSNASTEAVLVAMSDIDKAVLSNASFEQLVELALPSVFALFPCQKVAIKRFDMDESDSAYNTYIYNAQQQHSRALMNLGDTVKQELYFNHEGILLNKVDDHASLQPFLGDGVSRVFLLPIYIHSSLSAALYFGLSEMEEYSTARRQLARDFADRFGVALTTTVLARQLFHNSHYDLTTSLLNREYCIESFSLEVSRANRYKSRVGVFYIGLGGYKRIVEIAGFPAADQVLKQVADRFRMHLRDTDLISRFSDDTFVVILPEIADDQRVSAVAEKLIRELSAFYQYGVDKFYLSCRIGISTYPEDGQIADGLLRKADFAMAQSKEGEFTFHTKEIHAAITNKLTLARDLRKALEKNELFVLYQPQVDLRKEKVVGIEALVRWQHPKKGLIPSVEFLAIAEETDLITKIGSFVREQAFEQFSLWQKHGTAPDRIALNISSKELMHHTFVEGFQAQLAKFELSPSSIEIEITESLLIDVTKQVKDTLEHLRSLGIVVAIDDFGTGYSSLSYIAKLPFDVLKMDRAFVSEIGKSTNQVEIVSLILDMAHHLGKKVCAEGVETREQLEYLRSRGCETVQGFLFAKPLAAKDVERFSMDLSNMFNTMLL